ncbi:MAG: DUF4876 domain-containing protein [Bacteroidales bacterium]|nr:DUF4876 domain-containing protein [Bacteroidales bacterium]
MKKILSLFAITALCLSAVSCEDLFKKIEEIVPVPVAVQLVCEGEAFPVADITVTIADQAGTFSVEEKTEEGGIAIFSVKPGIYTASATYTTSENGQRLAYTGATAAFEVSLANASEEPVQLDLKKVASQQIVVKELYTTGCPSNDGSSSTANDAYVILYNNSDIDADASNVVFGFLAPYNAHGTNKYYVGGGEGEEPSHLLYENDSWIPSYGAIWWFTAPVTIPAYSQIVVSIFGAIDFTQTYTNSVNLANPEYYWMSNSEINPPYTNAKYTASDVIPSDHYLTCSPFTQGNAWAISSICPAFFIGNMPKAEVEALSKNTEAYDHTLGPSAAMNVVKFPKENVIGAVEVWSSANIDKSNVRFPADINTGYVAIANKLGYTVYRNVDAAATEALPENAGKLVYNYAGALDEAEGITGEKGIDAEASIANGAHIIYKQTNNTANDFHIRKVSSLK